MVTFTNIIDYYGNGTTGTVALSSGDSVDYTISTNIGENRLSKDYGEFTGSVAVQSNENANYFEVTFSEPVQNVVMGITASDAGDGYAVLIDGVEVDLLDLLNNGLITISDPAAHIVNSNGQLEGDGGPTDDVTYIQFNFALTSIGATGGIDSPSGPSGVGVDFFEIGINEFTAPACFCTGTMIETATGPKPVETLEVGERVLTRNGSYATLRYVLSTEVTRAQMALNPALRPVKIDADAFGKGMPLDDLYVSQQHRMLVTSRIAERICRDKNVLVAAIKLTGLPGIAVADDVTSARYFHLIFDHHQVIYANGAPTESLYFGDQALKALPKKARDEIAELFPDLLNENREQPHSAACIPSGRQQRELIARHRKNGKALHNTAPRPGPRPAGGL